MKGGVKIFLIGFVLAVLGSIIPVLGIPGLVIGVLMMMWGIWQFIFGAAWGATKAVGKGVSKAAGDKTGTGKL